MEALQLLLQEHRLIAQMTDALERYVARVEQDEDPARHELGLLVTFFREFADMVHHEKEESILIPALVRSGMSWDWGPVDEIRKEHNLERYLMQSLRHASLQAKAWTPPDRRHLVDVARSFIEFLRDHMTKEERVLFPAIRSRLSDSARDDLAQRLERFDKAREAAGDAEIVRQLTRELLGDANADRADG